LVSERPDFPVLCLTVTLTTTRVRAEHVSGQFTSPTIQRHAWHWLKWLVGLYLAVAAPLSWASLGAFCTDTTEPGAAVQDRLIQVAAVVKAELAASGHRAAIVARSGLALKRLGQRYSHAGVSLHASPNAPWSVRQLYFACDERRPRIFDQGLPGFVLGVHDAEVGFVSALLLPPEPEAALIQAALDDALALQLLGSTYSANAHAFALTYQNCNQWLAELLATAWGGLSGGLSASFIVGRDIGLSGDASDGGPEGLPTAHRAWAQAWLRQQGYQATLLDMGWRPLLWLANLSPWVHTDDHPAADLAAARLRVSMPEGLERFVRVLWPATQRLEFCYTSEHVLLRHGWAPLPDDCQPGDVDQVVPLTGAKVAY
jgi:hypothetical protein